MESKASDARDVVVAENRIDESKAEDSGSDNESAVPEPNPFELPSDDQVFILRERERKLKQEKRERLKKMSVWEKTQQSTKRKGISWRALDKEGSSSMLAKLPGQGKALLGDNAVSTLSPERRHEKENMTDFIAKKREMFLVQMSLDTKREEIRKLEEKAQLKEEALRKSELMLEEDAIRFDTFLKENDKKAHEAIKRAEMETKLKQDKVQEIKKLNLQIQAVQGDMSKLKEQLADCLKYKTFLDELTPPEWFEEQKWMRRQRKRKAQRQYKAHMMRRYEAEKKRILREHEELRSKEEARAAGRPRTNRRDQNSALQQLPKIPDPPTFDFSDDETEDEDATDTESTGASQSEEKEQKSDGESKHADGRDEKGHEDKSSDGAYEDDSEEKCTEEEELPSEIVALALSKDSDNNQPEEELPMYFQDPSQLLNIFTQLEESNLFLIQNSQETEQALEELKQEFRETKQKMDIKTDSLKSNIDELRQQIDVEESKAELLRNRIDSSMGEDAQEALLRELHEKVKEVYRRCGFDCDASPSTLSMLTDLEARLEDLLGQIEHMPEEYVIKAEKLKEKERRERVRAERMAQQQQVYEERLRKSIERSMQAPKKKTGKPAMFRSAPPQRKVRKKDDSAAEEKAQDMKEFFSW